MLGILQTLRAPSTHKEIASFAVRRALLLPHSLILHSDAYKNSLVFGCLRQKYLNLERFVCFFFDSKVKVNEKHNQRKRAKA